MLILLLAVDLRLLPTSGRGDGLFSPSGWKHLIMPALTLSSFSMAAITRLARSAMLDVLPKPLHPYTQMLLAACLTIEAIGQRGHAVIDGEMPDASNPPSGCRFRTRCPRVFDRCSIEEPGLREIEAGRLVACHLSDPAGVVTGGQHNDVVFRDVLGLSDGEIEELRAKGVIL